VFLLYYQRVVVDGECAGCLGIGLALYQAKANQRRHSNAAQTKQSIIVRMGHTTSDTDVNNFSQINYKESPYNGEYSISGVGVTTFDISLKSVPNSLNYTTSNTNTLKYTTLSKTATGGIDKMSISFGGIEYKKLPRFTGITSTNLTFAPACMADKGVAINVIVGIIIVLL